MKYRAKGKLTAALIVITCLAGKATAGPFEDGVAAYQRGDYVTAMRLWRPLADQGVGDAQYNIGIMFDKGRGVRANATAAAGWYRKAADLGVADAQCDLGTLFDEGRGVAQDSAAAVRWYRKAADQANSRCQWALGNAYLRGEGVPENDVEAMKWLRKAADQNYASAQTDLGSMYANGKGVKIDFVEALKWYRKAADEGDSLAQMNIGAKYANGQGVPKDLTEAIKWYRLAADQGEAKAQFILAIAYIEGKGLQTDIVEAAKWLRKAADQDYPDAKSALAVVNKAMQDQQTTRATSEHEPSSKPSEPSMALRLKGADLPRVVSTYRENEMRFKRDFFGKKFSDVMPFLKATEKLFSKDSYTISFGESTSADCSVTSPEDISTIANWNKGDKIYVEGIIRDVTMGSVQLDSCTLSK